MMNFMDAVTSMQAGNRVIRSGWVGYYLTVLYGQNYIWSIGKSTVPPSVNANIYVPSLEDFFATDWIVKTN